MGGAKKQRPTAQEHALAEVAAGSHNRFREHGIPIRSEYIKRTIGLEQDENGDYQISGNGVRNPDGSIRTDVTDARTATNGALGDAFKRFDPNKVNQVVGANEATAGAGAETETQLGISQQDKVLAGEQNVVKLGQGEQVEHLASQTQLAQQANQSASQSALQAQQSSQANQYLVGQVAGAAAAHFGGGNANASTAKRSTLHPDQMGP